MTTVETRLGAQVPPQSHIPAFFTNLGDDATDLAAAAGLDLDEWQQFVLRGSLGLRRDSKFSARDVCLIVPRQNGKGSVLEARELCGLFLLKERLILHSAHEFKTAKEAYLRIKSLIEQTDDLMELTKQFRNSNEDVSVELHSGARLRFVARSKGSGRGFTGDMVVLDEAYELPDEVLEALIPTLSARPNPQIWYTSSTGMDSSVILKRVRERGLSQDKSLAYFEWCAEKGADPDDRDQWYRANPALGIRIDEETIESERSTLSDEGFGRERLGLWADRTINKVVDAEVWKSTEKPSSDLDARVVGQFAVAIDVSPDRSMAAIGIAGRTASGVPCLQVIEHHRGTSWVVEKALALMTSSSPPVAIAVDAGGAAGSLIPALTAAGIEPMPLTLRDVTQGCGSFYDAAHSGALIHLPDVKLATAVDGATKRTVGNNGAWAWGRRDSTIDICPLVSVTNAMHALTVMSVPEAVEQRTGKVW